MVLPFPQTTWHLTEVYYEVKPSIFSTSIEALSQPASMCTISMAGKSSLYAKGLFHLGKFKDTGNYTSLIHQEPQ